MTAAEDQKLANIFATLKAWFDSPAPTLGGADAYRAAITPCLMRSTASAQVIDAARELIDLLPVGSFVGFDPSSEVGFELGDRTEQSGQGGVHYLGIRFASLDHAIKGVDQVPRFSGLLRRVALELLHLELHLGASAPSDTAPAAGALRQELPAAGGSQLSDEAEA